MDLESEVSALPGVGEKTASTLKKAGFLTVKDLLYYLPREYENYQSAVKICDLNPGKVTIIAKVKDAKTRYGRRRNFTITEATLYDDTDSIRAVWFNQPYRAKQLETGREFLFVGSYEFKNGRYQLMSPSVNLVPEELKDAASPKAPKSAILPVYSAKTPLKSTDFSRLFKGFRPEFAKIQDLLPRTEHTPDFVKPGARKEALFKAHYATTETEANQAREYLAYEELFELILAARLNRQENQKLRAEKIPYNDQAMKNLLKSLKFALTDAQKLATWEIIKDLDKPTPMNRLLQGDVGAGKTVVAAAAALQAVQSGFQVALLAPTAVLAVQHAESLNALLGPLGVKIGLLTGATKHKTELKKQIKQGTVDLVIGTHALITDDTEFHNLALCIIDEQHRFGVNQRQKLLLKSPAERAPHLLSMTATPIPRSLQLTVFGDLEISTIKQLPKGRQPIKTKAMNSLNAQDDLYPKVREELEKGRQVYWICKNIEDVPSQETISVKKQAETLKQAFKQAKVEFLHGRMKQAQKDEIMENFASGKIDILVSTTVIEVGVNVPNASTIVIMDAENYGLAQLHQLRGRVGRGQHQSYCYLLVSGDKPPTRRLKELENSTDGFYLAEVDLKLRGPGEIYGSLQHGALDLRIASLSDTHLIAKAQKHAADVAKNPEIMLEYKELSRSIKRYQQLTTLN
ncbi:ATP-dependent DNA helicase RecG [Candidatus Saccharibacteria bacterium]|nr:ATP-dependent DNA helicase RecG [Candidatus Saccharibacteria bacterium]